MAPHKVMVPCPYNRYTCIHGCGEVFELRTTIAQSPRPYFD